MADQHVLLEVSDYIATITLNRPEAMNAFTNAMIKQITDWLHELRERDDVRVVILRGAGHKAFSAGHDLKATAVERRAGGAEGGAAEDLLASTLISYPKPTIAAVRGYVRTGGIWIACSCDLLVAAEDSTFAITAIRFGNFAVQLGVPVMRRVGRSRLVDMILTCDVLDAQEAKAFGLADRVIPVERFEEEVKALASKIASRDPQAVRAGKEALALLTDMDTLKMLRAAFYANQVQRLGLGGERGGHLIEEHLASARGTGATRRSYE